MGASDLVRDRFLRNICHELRTPINGVIGMLELLRDTALTDDQRMYTVTAQHSAEHLLTLIDELLDLSLLESGTLTLQETSFDLQQELMTAVEMHLGTAKQHSCNLNVRCSIPNGTRAFGDAVRLRQLVASLLDSTLKKNPQTTINFTLDVTIKAGGKQQLQLVLSNPAGPLQCDADGLAWRFTQSLAEHLGTRIELDEGYGYTAFKLMLDLSVIPNSLAGIRMLSVAETEFHCRPLDAELSEASQNQALGMTPTFAGRCILVADDHIVNQQIAARMLEKFGCEVDVAADGRTAIAMHEARHYDLILMDCQMPIVDGYQATARIRAMDTPGRRTPIVGWTSFALQEERQRCLGAGMDDFMVKPLRPSQLHDILKKWLPSDTMTQEPTDEPLPEDELESTRDIFGLDFVDLANLFMQDSQKRIEAIHTATAHADSVQLAKFAHSFAGSAASIGASGLSSLCRSLEADAKTGTLDRAAATLKAIDKEFARVKDRLNSMIARMD